MEQGHDTVRDIVEAVVVLHNLLRLRNPVIPRLEVDHEDEQHNFIPGSWRVDVNWEDEPQPHTEVRNTGTGDAKQQREYLKQYFSSPGGAVAWQDQMINP